ncbi:hypothetical protein L596_027652 [Steinernema carpocapsae]|uniref:Uncharacterized protein n=1 Tax=Steinernema carpocapsae TaxID=34508 RepID=A0A4U5LW24_STECR|nr:hypothetical protein L596_027652 [Steinernema carpocapsae]
MDILRENLCKQLFHIFCERVDHSRSALGSRVLLFIRLRGSRTGEVRVRRRTSHSQDISEMQVSDRDLRVLSNECVQGGECFGNCKAMLKCRLCEQCILEDDRADLAQAYSEHVSKGAMRRLLPSTTIRFPKIALTQIDRLQTIWFDRKCKLDSAWCH